MASVATPTAVAQREWRRFTPAQRLGRFAIYLLLVLAIVASLRTIEIIPEFLYDAPDQVVDLLTRMWPIAWEHYPTGVHAALVETLHIASLGTLLALLLATPVGILAANRLVPSALLNWLARLILVSSRSVNSLVWALIFVGIFGPGPLAGTLAIAFRSIGFVGKLVGEALDETQPGPVEALRATGAPWMSVLSFGYWPQVKPAFWSIALFRFDINVRESAVLGLVGAGGVGMAPDAALHLFPWGRVALILVAMFVVVIAAEVGVTQVRKRLL
jgi:phosphonate transport system permease protein